MFILGIDPGFGRMGFGCLGVEHGAMMAVDFGVITTAPADLFERRLLDLAQDLRELIVRHEPQSMAIEKLFFDKNSATAMRVAEARGVALMVAAEQGLVVYEFTPAQVKKALTGDGVADKGAVQRMVKMLLKLATVPKPDDAADALAVAIAASTIN